MKKYYLFFFPLIFLGMFISKINLTAQEQILNGNFEIWESQTLYESPVGWLTENYPEIAHLKTIKETNAADGDYSIKLVTVEIKDDEEAEIDFGFLLFGNLDTDFPKRMPWSETIDKLHFSTRYDIGEGDAALVWIMLSKDGSPIFEKFHPITGSLTEWGELTIDFEFEGGTAIQPDSMLLAFVSSSPEMFEIEMFKPVPGSWISIDNVYFTLGESTERITPPNHSLEIWEDVTIEDPQGWTSSNLYTIEFDKQNVTKSTDSYSGTYAARMEVIETLGFTEQAILSYGGDLWPVGVPYKDMPEGFSIAAKYSPVGDDDAYIYVTFRKEGVDFPIAGNNITLTKENQTYRRFGTTFFFPPDMNPDTIILQIFAGNNPGTVLLVDDLKFGPARNITFNVKSVSEETLAYAMVTFDGQTSQQTDPFGVLVSRMPEGNFHFTVEKELFVDYQGTVTVSGEDVIINVLMIPEGGTFIESEEIKNRISIYPNPAKDVFYINNFENVKHITIASIHGQIVFDTATGGNVQSVDTAELEKGMYVVSLRTVQGNLVQLKLVVK